MIRATTEADTEAFVDLQRDGIAQFPDAFALTAEEARATDLEQLTEWLNSGETYGAFDGERMIGFAGVSRLPLAMARHRATIGPFYVMPEHHGTGMAQALLDRVFADCTALGVLQLELWVWQGNARARAFFRRNGFVQRGTIPRAGIMEDGKGRDDLFMITALDG